MQLVDTYLNNWPKKIEIFTYVVFYILMTFMIERGPSEYRGLLSTAQIMVSVLMAFRFTYLGFILYTLINARDFPAIILLYIETNRMDYAIGIALRTVSMLTVIIISILSYKKDSNQKQLQKLAITDGLTCAFNQRHFQEVMDREFETAMKDRHSLGLILIDLDDFKIINSIYGHNQGDAVLKAFANFLNSQNLKSGLVFRTGGDEFAILVPRIDLQSLELMASLIREELGQIKLQVTTDIQHHDITVSMGISHYPQISNSKDELISHADLALYHAKNQGKDNIHFYKDVIIQIQKSISADHQQFIGAFKTLLSAISTKDQYTLVHSERVSEYAVMIGEAFGMSPKDISILQYAGLLHDIGKIEIPQSVLNKIEPLTDEEYRLIRLHPVYSSHILEPLRSMGPLIDYVRHHHERMDGTGYPDGLSGAEISLGARILCVADAFDAMLSERPYKKSRSANEAFAELLRCSDQFDPEVVRKLVSVLKRKIDKEGVLLA